MQDPVGLVDDARRLNKASQRPREPASRIDHPVVERVADAAAQRSHQLDLLGEVGVGCGPEPRELVRRQSVQDRQVGLDAQKQTRRQHAVVASLDAAAEAAEGLAEAGRVGLAETDLRAAAAVPDMAAEIEAVPIVRRNARGGLDRHLDGDVGGLDGVAQADGQECRAEPVRSSSVHNRPQRPVRARLGYSKARAPYSG